MKILLKVIVDKTKEINKFIVANDKPKTLKSTSLQDFDLLLSNSRNNSLVEISRPNPFIWQTSVPSKKSCSTPK